jgi:hypothetical protein
MKRHLFFPKSLVLGILSLVLILQVGLLLFIYFQGGVEGSIYLPGAAGMAENRAPVR